MTPDYINMTTEQLSALERAAFADGDTDRAALLAAVADLINATDKLEEVEGELKTLTDQTHDDEEYKQFFDDCFDCLGAHYPCPEVSSDHDKSVIFYAIRKGEGIED